MYRRSALVVLLVVAAAVAFTGGIVAMIAIGRTLKRPEDPAEE